MGALDDVWGDGGTASPATPTPSFSESPVPVATRGALDDVWGGAPSEGHSETRAVMNDALRGAGGFLSLVDEISPVQLYPPKLKIPHMFGLGPKSDQEPFYDLFNRVTKDYGLQTEDKPQTQVGKFLGNVAENAVGALPFGPLAAVGSGVLGGTGGYLGEMVSPTYGRAAGSAVASLTPAALSKLGIAKEIGEWLGPTISQFPGVRAIFGDAPIQSAVGRTLVDVSDNPVALEKSLTDIADFVGPPTQLNALKTTAEMVGDSGIARSEEALQNLLPNAPFKQIAQERAAARTANVLGDYTPTLAYDTSKGIEGAITKSVDAVEGVEKLAWNALPKDLPVITKGLEKDLVTALDDITYTGALKLEGEGAGLLNQFTNATDQGVVSMGVIQELRKKALKVARATANPASSADRTTNQVAHALEEHLRKIVDANAASGAMPDDVVKIWEGARSVTAGKYNTFGAPLPGVPNQGTKGIEKLALKGMALDSDALLREGLSSPDKLASHVQAAAAGGQDVRPFYQEALKSELDGTSQTRWADIVNARRKQWEMVFTPEEMASVDRNLADIANEAAKNKLAFTSGSATNPRGNVQRVLERGKGAANLVAASKGAPALLGALAGAQHGWNKGESTAGSIGNALLYGIGGAVVGRGLNSAALAAGAKYDAALASALKDPRAALSAIQAAKPSNIASKIGAASAQAAGVAAANVGASAIRSFFKGDNESKNTSVAREMFEDKAVDDSSETPKAKNIAATEAEIDADPYYSTLYEIESSRNPLAVHKPAPGEKQSSAKGGFQLVDGTAKALGVKDPFDLKESFEGIKKLTKDHEREFGSDPKMLYAAHYLGATTLRKAMKGEPLDKDPKRAAEKEAQVRFLVEELWPRIERIYATKVTKA